MRAFLHAVLSALLAGTTFPVLAEVREPGAVPPESATSSRDRAAADQLRSSRRVLAVGDSLTAGYNVARAQSYPSELARRLGVEVRNAGISGETSSGLLRRLPALLGAGRYDTVLLCTGGNDWLRGQPATALEANLERAIDLIRQAGATPILVAVPMLPLALADHPVYARVASRKNVALAGGFGMVLGRQHFQPDGLHPNAEGYRQIVDRLLAG
jgi:acyl-CoA thioesterase I